jgi:dodecin
LERAPNHGRRQRGNAVETAASTVRELRVAEVVRQDVTIENGQVTGYRIRLAISFKYESTS